MRAKPVLAVVCILAGCGGGGNGNWQQVEGDGFTYDAPSAWTVKGATATRGSIDLVQVRVFRLVRPYDATRRAAVARELDGAAARLAAQLTGEVATRRWLVVAGVDGRLYDIRYGAKLEEITFVLDGQREYQLLCRRAASGDDAPCAELLRSFTLG